MLCKKQTSWAWSLKELFTAILYREFNKNNGISVKIKVIIKNYYKLLQWELWNRWVGVKVGSLSMQ